VLALSNPTSSAEVSFTDALRWSKGKVVYASGSPFPPAGSSTQPLLPAQANNALVFPGLALGTLRSGAAVDDAMLLEAARAVTGCVSDDELAAECVLPRIGRLAHVTAVVADAVAVAGAAAAAGTSV
jgi:malate dehydrogenase (oxaloacetate-decarboxylating)(NADP+)